MSIIVKYRTLPTIVAILTVVFLNSACSSSGELTKNLIEPPAKEEEAVIASAMDAYDRGLFSKSREEWISLRDGYPASYFIPLAQMKIADCYFVVGNFPEAVAAYQEYLRLFPANEAASYAQYRLGESYFKQYRGVKNDQQPLKEAMRSYQKVLDTYPQSDYSKRSQEQIVKAQAILLDYDRYVADFYEKQGELKAANGRRVTPK